MKDPNTIHSSTQQFLDIYDITNDILILKDGSASLILQVNAVNFGLLAEAEQDAIIYAYAGLLNSLNFPVQIVIRSETKDVSHYLHSLQEQEEATPNETRKQQIKKYRSFVSQLIRERNVLDKKFYFILPASALELGLVSAESVVPGVKKAQAVELDRSLILDRALTNLYPKRDHLIGQFARIGLYARQLTTQEIIHLFYNLYNPEAAEGQSISNTQNYTTAVVEAMQGVTMTDASQNQTPTAPNPTTAPTPARTTPPTQANMPITSTVPTTGTPGISPQAPQTTPPAPATPAPTTPVTPAAPTPPTPPASTTPAPASTTPGLPPLPNLPTPQNPIAPTVESPGTSPSGSSTSPTDPADPVNPATPTLPTPPAAAPQPAVPTITPAQPPAAKPPMTPPSGLPNPTSSNTTTAPAAPATPASGASAASLDTPAVESEQDAQSLINNTLQQIDPTSLKTSAAGLGAEQNKTE